MSIEPYIKIPNYIYDPIVIEEINTGTLFHRIGTGGFSVLSFLQIVQENKSFAKIRITDIKNELNMKKNETALKYFNALIKENLISIEGKNYGDKIKSLEFLTFSINPDYLNAEQFEAISVELFNNKIKSIGINGWAMICYLTKLHNYTYGDNNTSLGLQGYSHPTYEQLCSVLNIRSNHTVCNILELLESHKLISIVKSNTTVSYLNSNGVEKFKKTNNKYIVHSKIPNRKYFLSINQPGYDKAMQLKKLKQI